MKNKLTHIYTFITFLDQSSIMLLFRPQHQWRVELFVDEILWWSVAYNANL